MVSMVLNSNYESFRWSEFAGNKDLIFDLAFWEQLNVGINTWICKVYYRYDFFMSMYAGLIGRPPEGRAVLPTIY